ncbi:MAG: TonB-dependent receptor [Blastomonas sp.]
MSRSIRSRGLAATVSLLSLSVAAMPVAANAQDDEQEEVVAPMQESAESGSDDGMIVVTGSRIRRSEYNSADPLTIIDPNVGLKQGQVDTGELLRSSPIAAGSVQITSVISNNFVTNGGADAQTISLRGLGPERTLVLLNGRRAGPAGVRGAVASFDLNVLPSSIIRSVEILKTGASSIYGSDAIAGVVNILTKTDTDGIEVRGFGSLTEHGGAETYNLSATYGKDFGRGHFLISADYFKQNDLRRNQRKYLDCEEEFLTFQAGGRADIIDARTGQPACGGVIGNLILTNNDFTGPGFSQGLLAPNGFQLFIGQYAVGNELDGIGIPFNGFPGVTAPANFFGLNFDGPSTGVLNQYLPLEQNSDVFSAVERFTGYLDASYEITDNVEVYTELLFNNRKSKSDGFQQLAVFQFTGNSILPAFFCDPSFDFNCSNGDAGDPFNNEFSGNFLLRPLVLTESDFATNIDYYRSVLGFRGDFGSTLEGWTWDIYSQYSRSSGKYTQDVIIEDSRFTQDFRTASCVGLNTTVRNVPCIDIDWTDPRVLAGNFTPEEAAFLFGEETGKTIFKQWSAEASVAGQLFSLPAGDVGVALGTTIRDDRINDTPGDFTLAGNVFGRTSSGITAGKTVTKELFGELEIPLIYNTTFFQRFALSAAARYTAVDATRRDGAKDDFSDSTWKVGFDWEVSDFLRFRGSWGTSFRAPALFELFLENQTGFQSQQDIDICINTATRLAQGTISQRVFDNCAAAGIPSNFQGATGSALITSGGGLGNLEPETSTAKTFSVVLTPEGWIWGGMQARIAVDYFDIKVKDEITTLGAANIISACYGSQFGLSDPICNQITRAASGPSQFNITDVRDTFVNINSQRNRGFDVTGTFIQDLGNLGTLTLLAQMTWQVEDVVTLFDGFPVDLNGENGEPQWVGDFNLTWDKGPWSVFYGLDVIGGTSDLEDLIATQGAPCRTSVFRPGGPFCPDVRLSPTFYHSASVTYDFDDRFSVTLGVANLFDTAPPRASTVFSGISNVGQAPVFGSQYDLVGRRAFLSVGGKF